MRLCLNCEKRAEARCFLLFHCIILACNCAVMSGGSRNIEVKPSSSGK